MGKGMFADDLRAYEEALSHHGILGQHWGTRHGPPYPLDNSVSTGKKLISSKAGKTASKGEKSATSSKKKDLKSDIKTALKAGLVGAVAGPYAANMVTAKHIAEMDEKKGPKGRTERKLLEDDHPEIKKLANDGEKNWCRFNVWERDGGNDDMITNKDAQAASVLIDRGYSVMQKNVREGYGSITSPEDIAGFFKGAKIENVPRHITGSIDFLDTIDLFLEKHSKEKGFLIYEIDDKSPGTKKPAKYAAIEIGKDLGFGGEDGHYVGRKVPQYGGGQIVSDVILWGNGMGRVIKGLPKSVFKYDLMGKEPTSGVYYIRTDNLELDPSIFDHVTPV